jgi:type II secretory pathway pseudopilin PulG
MARPEPYRTAAGRFVRSAHRRGFSILEVLAAASLTVVALAAITPLFARQVRLVAETRRERIALEELANQAERLAAVPRDALDGYLARLAPSPLARDRLPAARLTVDRGGMSPLGERLLLAVSWQSPGRADRPLTLAIWLPPAARSVPEGSP